MSVYNLATNSGSQIRIYADNPYIPAAIRALIPTVAGPASATPPAQSFVLARGNYDVRRPF